MHYPHTACTCHPSPSDTTKLRLLWTALMFISGFALMAGWVGLHSHSLALLAESGHMISDCAALVLALLATWIARRPASGRATFGYRRGEVLAALVNGLGLVAIALWVGWEAIERLQQPSTDILGIPMLITAAVGFGVNTLNAFLLHDHSHHDLNLKGAFLHMVADALSSIGVLLAAIAIWLLHWNWADGAISLVVSGLILAGALPLIRQSLNVLLEKTPDYLDLATIQTHLETVEGVVAVDQLRVWAIAPGQEALAAHLRVTEETIEARDRLLQTLKASLQQTFGIQEIYLQMSALVPAPPIDLSRPGILLLNTPNP